MAVFRIERTKDYTVMSNHHLRNHELSLKAKGLLSMMLSLPDDWNYTTRGLAKICKEGTDSIGARLGTRLKERFNQSNLFTLNDDEEKDMPKLRLLVSTAPEFPGRPGVGSVYGVSWVFSQGKGYLGYLLAREVGTVNYDDLDALVDRLVERTDGIAAKYGNLWK